MLQGLPRNLTEHGEPELQEQIPVHENGGQYAEGITGSGKKRKSGCFKDYAKKVLYLLENFGYTLYYEDSVGC